jgi:hypothetical protein
VEAPYLAGSTLKKGAPMLTIFLGILSLWLLYLLVVSILNSILQHQERSTTTAFSKLLLMKLFDMKRAYPNNPDTSAAISEIEHIIHNFENNRKFFKNTPGFKTAKSSEEVSFLKHNIDAVKTPAF